MKKHVRTLSPEGKKELGHIFVSGYVPCRFFTPTHAEIGDLGEQRVFLVDWQTLSDEERSGALQYMSEKFGEPQEVIRAEVESNGGFPIRHEWVIESYSMRMFM